MLDTQSLEVITRFKQALLTKSLPLTTDSHVLDSNRGNKLQYEKEDSTSLNTKVVEYNGINYLVTSNGLINRLNRRNKRKWHDYYQDTDEYRAEQEIQKEQGLDEPNGLGIPDNSDESEEDDDDDDDDNEDGTGMDPLRDIDLTEILLSLTHPSELVSHPAVLRTFKLNVLSRLASELIELIETEHETLNWFYKLLQVLNGEDWYYLLEDSLGLPKYDHGLTNDDKDASKDQGSQPDTESTQDTDSKRITRTATTEDDEVTDPFFMLPETLKNYELHQSRIIEEPEAGKENDLKNVQEDLINYLQVSIQRQQEYIKNLTKLRTSIIRADRLKSTLLKWGKEMYDKKSS